MPSLPKPTYSEKQNDDEDLGKEPPVEEERLHDQLDGLGGLDEQLLVGICTTPSISLEDSATNEAECTHLRCRGARPIGGRTVPAPG